VTELEQNSLGGINGGGLLRSSGVLAVDGFPHRDARASSAEFSMIRWANRISDFGRLLAPIFPPG